jgi:hypothetical protein
MQKLLFSTVALQGLLLVQQPAQAMGWIESSMHNRRKFGLTKDWECSTARTLAFLRLASVRLMLRKLRYPYDVSGQTLRVPLGCFALQDEYK